MPRLNDNNRFRFDSYIGQNNSWWHYYNQYKFVIDDLVTSIENGTNPIDTVSLPLMFLIRHSIEVGLKANILRFQKINRKIQKIRLGGSASHSIEFLYDRFMQHLMKIVKERVTDQAIINQIKEYKNSFDPLKDMLHKLDKGSFNFRYPVNVYGVRNFTWDTRVNLTEIVNYYYEIQPLLLYTENVFEELGIITEN